jgi:riboflavin synthase
MFTGLIEMTAQVTSLESIEGGRRLRLATPIGAETRRGDSVAVNGVCLTAIDVDATGVAFDVSPETLRVTTLGTFARGRRVNLERPLRADARIGGHFVLGHVDAVGRIRSIRAEGDSHWIEIEFPRELAPLLVPKGSIAVDGISLTVAALNADHFGVQIVPFTRQHTALGEASIGDAVNLEADVLGKHVARLMSTERIGWQS